jgi:hypothetical protein
MIGIVVPFLGFEIDVGLIHQRTHRFLAIHSSRIEIVTIKTKLNYFLPMRKAATSPRTVILSRSTSSFIESSATA